jgi:hypothetical protein
MKTFHIILVILFIGACSEVTEFDAKNAEEAKPFVEAGWLPKWLPETATDIRQAHDIDTNAVVAAFNPNAGVFWHPDACSEIGILDPPSPDLKVDWWPGNVPLHPSSIRMHIFYMCANKSYLAVTPDGKTAYYWLNTR